MNNKTIAQILPVALLVSVMTTTAHATSPQECNREYGACLESARSASISWYAACVFNPFTTAAECEAGRDNIYGTRADLCLLSLGACC
jgi:hypothetical protein